MSLREIEERVEAVKASRQVIADPRLPARFWQKVHPSETGCWFWLGQIKRNGYGVFYVGPGQRLAHRVAYETLVAPVPAGKELDHLCRVPRCVNPSHLEPVSHRENVLRGKTFVAEHAKKTHCAHGHALAGNNLRTRFRDGNERRECRECHRVLRVGRDRRYRARALLAKKEG